jgi:hypothetical protein
MTDDIDRLLRAQGERWRASVPPPPDATTALRQGRARVRRTQVLGAAAAVLVVAGGLTATVGLLNRGDQRNAPPAGPTRPANSTGWPAGAVPWQPLAATNPTLPSTTSPPSPDPADAAGIRSCTAGDLRASIGPGDGAGGTLYRRVLFTLVGSDPCRLSGYPAVEPLSHGHRLDLPTKHESSPDALFGPITPVRVAPRQPAVVTVAWAVSYSCPAVDNDRLRVTLPGIATAFTVAGFGTSTCETGQDAVSPLLIGPVHPLNSTPARTTSPYDGVTVAGDLNLTAHADQPLDFAVTLTSKHDLPLDPCPDYTISTSAGESSYALNCAAVPHRDAQGRPYLPAGVPVTFAMRADPGQASTPKFLWRLTTPRSALVLVVGTLTVTGSTGPAESTVVGTVSLTGAAATPDLDGTVTASRSDGLTRTAPVNAGTFLLSLPLGRWQLVAHSQQYNHGAPCRRDAPLDLSTATSMATSIHISCPGQ